MTPAFISAVNTPPKAAVTSLSATVQIGSLSTSSPSMSNSTAAGHCRSGTARAGAAVGEPDTDPEHASVRWPRPYGDA